jgi:hypothetical protein
MQTERVRLTQEKETMLRASPGSSRAAGERSAQSETLIVGTSVLRDGLSSGYRLSRSNLLMALLHRSSRLASGMRLRSCSMSLSARSWSYRVLARRSR